MVANLRTQTVYILEPPGDGLAMSKGWPEGMAGWLNRHGTFKSLNQLDFYSWFYLFFMA